MIDTHELMRIVHQERLETPILYGVGRVFDESVVLTRDGAAWEAYVANERAGAIGETLQIFDNESDALEYVLLKLRQMTKYHRSLAMDEALLDEIRVRRAT